MKINLVSVVFFFVMFYSCKKEDSCIDIEHRFNISNQTKEWLPDEILIDSLKFLSEAGEIIILNKDTIVHTEVSESFRKTCNGESISETILFERISHRYNSGDSLMLIMAMYLATKQCPWDEINEVKLTEEVWVNVDLRRPNSSRIIQLGFVDVITNLINVSQSEQTCSKQDSKLNDQIEIIGTTYQNIYSDNRLGREFLEFPLADVFLQKGKGVIGFRDEFGKEWIKIE